MTVSSRNQQINRALKARSELDPAEQPSHPVPWRGEDRYLPVIKLPIDVPLLNADSHRIRALLEASEYSALRGDWTSSESQGQLALLWQRAHRKYQKLRESLDVEGQVEPGVITREGVLIDGNSRLVAMRDLQRPDLQWIRCAVLDSDATPFDVARLELQYQVRDPVRDPYRLSGELLFIEDLANNFHLPEEEIARELRWSPSRLTVGARKVKLYRRLYQLVRELQRRDASLPITFFDEGSVTGKLQQLKELEARYSELVDTGDQPEADLLLDTWLVVARSGFPSVHQIRAVTSRSDFVSEYLVPRLGEQGVFQDRVSVLVHGRPGRDVPAGVDDLGFGERDDANVAFNLRALLRLVEAKDGGTVTLPGGDGVRVETDEVKEAIARAVRGAIQDQRAEGRADDELDAPASALGNAVRELKRATAAYEAVGSTKRFLEAEARGAFEYQLKQARRHLRRLEETVAEVDSARTTAE